MKDSQDEALIASILSDRPAERSTALKSLYSACYPSVKSFILLNKGAVEDAEDFFQEGAAILFHKLKDGKFKGQSAISTYLFAICRNLWLQELKKRSRTDDFLRTKTLIVKEEESFNVNPERLESIFKELKADCQRLLLAFYYRKLSIREIQQELKMNSEQVVRNKKKRCLNYLMNIVQRKNLAYSSFLDE